MVPAKSIPIAQSIQDLFNDMDYLHDIGNLNINISGCMNACGHHHVGHIGILGVDKDGSEWYQVTLGGNQGNFASIGKVIGPSFSAEEDHSEIHDLMAHLLDPAAEAIWDSAGFVITEEGEFSLEPKNQEEWDKVLYGAKVISESAFLLSRPEISKNRKDWIAVSGLLKVVGDKAFEAAERQDVEELFKVGADLYQVCVACHQTYMTD